MLSANPRTLRLCRPCQVPLRQAPSPDSPRHPCLSLPHCLGSPAVLPALSPLSLTAQNPSQGFAPLQPHVQCQFPELLQSQLGYAHVSLCGVTLWPRTWCAATHLCPYSWCPESSVFLKRPADVSLCGATEMTRCTQNHF